MLNTFYGSSLVSFCLVDTFWGSNEEEELLTVVFGDTQGELLGR